MADYLLWQRGLRGPAIAVMRNRGATLNEYERTRALSAPIKLTETDEGLTLDALAARYPVPAVKEDA